MILEKTFITLEYDKILSILKQHLASEIGLEFAEKLRPATALKEAETLQEQTWEAESIYTRTGRTPIAGFPDVRELVGRMHASLFLSTRELLAIAQAMRAAREAKEILQNGDDNSLLCNLANRLTSHRSVEEEIARCIPGEDEISDNASPELSRIRRQIKILGERVREKLNSMLKSQTTQKYLQEAVITIRNGRYVLPVKAECRSQVQGLVHDQSSSGATLFIEPSAVVEMGNESKRLFIEEKNEIERILSGLTAMIAPFADEIHISCNVMGALGRHLRPRDHGAGPAGRTPEAQRGGVGAHRARAASADRKGPRGARRYLAGRNVPHADHHRPQHGRQDGHAQDRRLVFADGDERHVHPRAGGDRALHL